MKLLDLYLEEIRRHLPSRNREDILKEIQSNLMDLIDDQYPGQPHDDEIIKKVLKEFGSPQKVARQYGASNYLIGPRIFPIYQQVLKIVLLVIAGLNVVGLIVTIVSGFPAGGTVLETSLEIVGGLVSSLFTTFGIVTLSFAAVERSAPETLKITVEEEWDPDQLLKDEDVERINILGLSFEITLSLIFIAFLNFFLDRIGIYYLNESGWVSAPILNNNFLRYIPWITASAVLDIVLNLYLIRTGIWDKRAVFAKLLINGFKIALALAIILGPVVITISPSAWQTLNFDLNITAESLSKNLNIGLDILLGLSIFGLVIDTLKRVYDHFIKGRHADIEIRADYQR